MLYKGYEIRAELRTLSQYKLDDNGNLIEAIERLEEDNIDGYYWVDVDSDLASDNLSTVRDVKTAIDVYLKELTS